ncbi:protein MMS22-like [Neocloeon triangulifer]|uniref:protein MMS22-like n=1 Tax=Neocloeon triangulifer TaxID=2078957 RepID=UPI00286F667B|nr:protein MMS22-like [Neocloeon triangulifer]
MDDFELDDEDLFADDEAFQNAIVGNKLLEARCFECSGKFTHAQLTQDFPFKSIVRKEGMDLAFQNSYHYKGLIEKAGENLILFNGAKYHASSAFLENMDQLFQMARKLFIKNEKDAVKHLMHLNLSKANYFDSRQKINLMFEYFTTFVQSLQSDKNYLWILEEKKEKVLQHLESWSILIHGLTKIEFNLLSACPDSLGNKCRPPMHHLLHLHLELRWHHLCLLHALTSQKTELNRNLEQALDHVLTELVKLAEGVKQEDYDRTHPFFCNCIREFWLMLQIFSDRLHASNLISMSFWGLMKGIVNRIFRPAEEKPPANLSKVRRPILCQDWEMQRKSSFALWLYLNICPIYGYSESGIYSKKTRGAVSDEGSNLLELILKKLTLSANENEMRDLMKLLLQLPQWWNVGMQALNLLLDHFVKHIGSLFIVPGESPAHLAFMARTAAEFSNQIKGHLRLDLPSYEGINSFHLFVKFLRSQMKYSWSDGDKLRFFNQVKSRICTRFSAGRMISLNDVGFYNLTSLCLSIGLSMGLEDMGSRLQGFLGAVEKGLDIKKREVIILSHMTLIYLKAEEKLSVEENIPPVTKFLNASCKDMNKNNLQHIEMVSSFIDSLNEVADVMSCDEISGYLFLGDWLPEYLGICNAARSAKVMSAMVDVASKLPCYEEMDSTAERRKAVASFVEFLAPYLKQESTKVTPSAVNQTADIAFAISAAAENSKFLEMLRHFGLNETVHARVSARYLTQILSNKEVSDRIRDLERKFDEVIVHAWMRCCVLDETNGVETEALTRSVCNLPDLKNLFGDKLTILKNEAFPLEVFGEMVHEQFKLRENNINERSELRMRLYPYFSKLPQVVTHIIQQDPNSKISATKHPSTTVLRMYESIGSLIMSCPAVMYEKLNGKSTLTVLTNTMLLYEDIHRFPTFCMDRNIKAALEAHFHKFLIGLGKIMKNDSYINRVMVASIKYFIHTLESRKGAVLMERRQPLSQAQTLHPIEKFFRVCISAEVVDKVVEIIGTHMLKMRGKFFENDHAPDALRILLNVQEDLGEDENLVRSLVKHTIKDTLVILMQIDDTKEAEKDLAFRYLKAIVNTPVFTSSIDIKAIFYAKLVELYREKMAFQNSQLFQLLFILGKYKVLLVKPTLMKLEQQIVEVETRRQTTNDQSLRGKMEKLARILGPVDNDDYQFDS